MIYALNNVNAVSVGVSVRAQSWISAFLYEIYTLLLLFIAGNVSFNSGHYLEIRERAC